MADLVGKPLGLTPSAFNSRVRKAAAAGDPVAKMALRAMVDRDAKAGRPPGSMLTAAKLRAWRCPTCKAVMATASGRDDAIKCVKGHTHPADPGAWARWAKDARKPLPVNKAKPAPKRTLLKPPR